VDFCRWLCVGQPVLSVSQPVFVTPGPHTLQCSLKRVSNVCLFLLRKARRLCSSLKPAQVNYGRTSPGRTGLYTHLNNWTRCLPRRRMHVPTHRPANQDHHDTIAAPNARFPKSHPSDLRLARARACNRGESALQVTLRHTIRFCSVAYDRHRFIGGMCLPTKKLLAGSIGRCTTPSDTPC
jgi:hypothetical protein